MGKLSSCAPRLTQKAKQPSVERGIRAGLENTRGNILCPTLPSATPDEFRPLLETGELQGGEISSSRRIAG